MLLFIQSDTPESHSSWSIFNQSGVYVIVHSPKLNSLLCGQQNIHFSLYVVLIQPLIAGNWTWLLLFTVCIICNSHCVYHMSQSLCVIYVWTFNVWRGNICNVVKVVRHLGTEMNCFWPNFKDVWGQLNLLKDLISYW